MRKMIAWLPLLVAAVVAVSGCGAAAPVQTITVKGRLTLTSSTIRGDKPCSGGPGFADIHVGTKVVIYVDGKIEPQWYGTITDSSRQEEVQCVFSFSVPGVAAGGKVYEIGMGISESDEFHEVDAGDVELELNSPEG
jgi:hypothetical protein